MRIMFMRHIKNFITHLLPNKWQFRCRALTPPNNDLARIAQRKHIVSSLRSHLVPSVAWLPLPSWLRCRHRLFKWLTIIRRMVECFGREICHHGWHERVPIIIAIANLISPFFFHTNSPLHSPHQHSFT